MKQSRLLYAKCVLYIALLMLPVLAQARSTYHTGGGVSHYLSLSLLGGEANTFTKSETYNLKDKLGADAQFMFEYELQKKRFFFNIGAHVHYTYTGQQVGNFTEAFDRVDRYADPLSYRYHYSDYEELQHTLLVGVPVQFGMYVLPALYIAAGLKFEYPLMTNYEARTNLMTDGMYDRFIEPFQDSPHYGFYNTMPVDYRSRYMQTKVHPLLAPGVEIGARFKLARKVSMRLGLYADYAIPLGAEHPLPIADYSMVDLSPVTQTADNLQQNLRLNSVLDNLTLKHDYSRLSVGLRCTVLFNLRGKPECNTCSDDSGIPYLQPRKIRKAGDVYVTAW